MNRVNEISELITKYNQRLTSLIPDLKLEKPIDLTNKLQKYKDKIQKEAQVDEDWFWENCINEKSIQGEFFENLAKLDEELFNMSIRLKNLNSTNNQITSSTTHFSPLVKHSKQILEPMKFYVITESEYRLEFQNNDDIIISLLYQRYDPPEVYIKRKSDEKYLRFGPMVEVALFGSHKLWDKHCVEDGKYFNFSSFEYYKELLTLIYFEMMGNINFVDKINQQIDDIYEELKTIS